MRRPSTLTQSTLSYASSRTKQTEEERELFTCSSILETALIMVRDLFYFIVGAFGFDPTPRLPSRARGLAPSRPGSQRPRQCQKRQATSSSSQIPITLSLILL